MRRYYLIPFEADEVKKQGLVACPEYLDELGVARGVRSINILDRYLVILDRPIVADFVAIEAKPDVIRLERTVACYNALKSLGLDLPPLAQIDLQQLQQKIMQWLGHDARTFDEV
jgi:hypothetical protein